MSKRFDLLLRFSMFLFFETRRWDLFLDAKREETHQLTISENSITIFQNPANIALPMSNSAMIFIRPHAAFYNQSEDNNRTSSSLDPAITARNAQTPSHDASAKPLLMSMVPESPKAIIKAQPDSAVSPKEIVEKTPLHRAETSKNTTISFDVAGFKPEHLNVEITDHVLIVTGRRTNRLGDTFVTCRRLALQVDIYDEDTVHANMNDGILEITIQKKVVPKYRQIRINIGPSSTSSLAPNQEEKKNNGTAFEEEAAWTKEKATTAPASESKTEEVSVETVVDDDEEDAGTKTKMSGKGSKDSSGHDEAWETVSKSLNP